MMNRPAGIEPILFAFCGPSASGKSTILRELAGQEPSLMLSISTTTRAPRGKETEGVDYYFVAEEEFEKRVANGLFLEHAAYGGCRYGTERRNIEDASRISADLLLDIDVQGAESLKKEFKNQLVVTFVFPPSFDELVKRLEARATEGPEAIKKRISIAEQEIEKLLSPGFSDYLLINDDLTESIHLARAIILAERMSLPRQTCTDALRVGKSVR